jgi:hypothetical protein
MSSFSSSSILSSRKKSSFISQIVYPNTLVQSVEPGFLIGWNTEQFECTIAGIVPFSVVSEEIREAYNVVTESVSRTYHDYHFSLWKDSKILSNMKSPIILGIYLPNKLQDIMNTCQEFQKNGIWIIVLRETISSTSSRSTKESVMLHSIYSLGFPYETVSYMVEYPSFDADKLYSVVSSSHVPQFCLFPLHSLVNANRPSPITDLFYNASGSDLSSYKTKLANIEITLAQINSSSDLLLTVYYYLSMIRKQHLTGYQEPNTRKITYVCERITHWLFPVLLFWHYLFCGVQELLSVEIPFLGTCLYFCNWNQIAPALVTLRDAGLTTTSGFGERTEHRNSGNNVIARLRSRFNRLSSLSLRGNDSSLTVSHFSFFFHEVHQVAKQFHSTFTCYSSFCGSWYSPSSLFRRKLQYLEIQHFVLFLLVNSLVGYYFSRALTTNLFSNDQQKVLVDKLFSLIGMFHDHLITANLLWIDSSPIGIKLNPFITEKFNKVILKIIATYSKFLFNFYYPLFLAFSRVFLIFFPFSGFTLQLSLLLDAVMMLALPITFLHMVISYSLRVHCQLLYSLWLLFNGRKYNIFRRRVDTYHLPSASSSSSPDQFSSSYHYFNHSNQLLFGILLFSIMFFLLPTMIIYYILFLILRIIVITIYFFLWNSIQFIKKFPFIYYFYRFYDYSFFNNRLYINVLLDDSKYDKEKRKVKEKERNVKKIKQEQHLKVIRNAKLETSFNSDRKRSLRGAVVESLNELSPAVFTTDDYNSEISITSDHISSDNELPGVKNSTRFTSDERKPNPFPSVDSPLIGGASPKLRNRKNLMLSLTEKFRQEDQEEEDVVNNVINQQNDLADDTDEKSPYVASLTPGNMLYTEGSIFLIAFSLNVLLSICRQ